MVNIKKIKALMGANDHTRKQIALKLGISTSTLRNKLNGKVDFKVGELKVLADIYNLPMDTFIEE